MEIIALILFRVHFPKITLYVEGRSTTRKSTSTIRVRVWVPRVSYKVTYSLGYTFSPQKLMGSSI